MDPGLKQAADARFDEALANTGARDSRAYYRERLAELKRASAQDCAEAVRYYEEELIPSIAEGGVDPVQAWRAFGLRLAALTAPGEAVAVDASGRRRPYEAPGAPGDMVLHLPKARRMSAFLVGLPPEPTPPQVATYDWLVAGRRALRKA